MWLNPNEEKIIGPFYNFVFDNENKLIELELNDGATVVVEFFSEAESDNDLEPDDKGYEEFREISLKITKILKDDTNKYKIGDVIDINYHCVPNSYKVYKNN